MHQPHFLLSAAARTLSLRDVFAMTEDQAFELFREVRWGVDGDPVCPDCGVADQLGRDLDVQYKSAFVLLARVGGKRTLTSIIRQENQVDVGTLAARFIAPGTAISTDESGAYDLLPGRYVTHRVNHQREYRAADGTTNNQAESYISRFRRMELGQHHHFGLAHLINYANAAADREDTRRLPNGEIVRDILTKCAHTPPHRDWCGYWQGNTRRPERLAA